MHRLPYLHLEAVPPLAAAVLGFLDLDPAGTGGGAGVRAALSSIIRAASAAVIEASDSPAGGRAGWACRRLHGFAPFCGALFDLRGIVD